MGSGGRVSSPHAPNSFPLPLPPPRFPLPPSSLPPPPSSAALCLLSPRCTLLPSPYPLLHLTAQPVGRRPPSPLVAFGPPRGRRRLRPRSASRLDSRGPMEKHVRQLIKNLRSRHKQKLKKESERRGYVQTKLQAIVPVWNSRQVRHGDCMDPNAGSFKWELNSTRARKRHHPDQGGDTDTDSDSDLRGHGSWNRPRMRHGLTLKSNAWTVEGCIRMAFSLCCFGRFPNLGT